MVFLVTCTGIGLINLVIVYKLFPLLLNFDNP